MIRVIAGIARGQKLKTLKGQGTRPTSERVREALFNILSPYIQNSRFLDLYAGTGAIGIEALSRGAKEVIFFEENPAAVRIIHQNLKKTKMQDKARVLCRKLPDKIDCLHQRKLQFDIIFADPPYWRGLGETTLVKIDNLDLLTDQGWVIIETASKELLKQEIGGLVRFKEKVYGDTKLSYYCLKEKRK